MEKPGRLQSTGPKESDTTEQLHFHFDSVKIGKQTVFLHALASYLALFGKYFFLLPF